MTQDPAQNSTQHLTSHTVTSRDGRIGGTAFDLGAAVTSWTIEGEEFLWLSSLSRYQPGVAIRGGVPICFPWFGPGRTGDASPKHGRARITEWIFDGEEITENSATLRFSLPAGTFEGEYSGLAVRYDVTFGEALELKLTVTNEGSEATSFEEALHTYIRVGDIENIAISGLEGAKYFNKVAGEEGEYQQDGAITFTGPTDRIYAAEGPVEIADSTLERRIKVELEGASNIVVWNPWESGAASMSDVGAGEWRTMVCVEGANVLDSAIHLEPGETHTLTYRLRAL
ncbi:MAG: D-hexose-6-phosphate mutarotase [Actinomycetaceae bacterium]|nr:D-hexose-6-phosphate mutarotase [Actinomycetaceae bacterium]